MRVYSAAMLGQGLILPSSGPLQRLLGLRWCAVIGGWLVSAGTLAASRATTVNVLSLSYGVVFGMGIGMAYSCPLVCGYQWMPKRKGTVSGVILCGFGGGSAIFNWVATSFVNPSDLRPTINTGEDTFYEEEVAKRVPGMFLLLGTCYTVLTTVGAFLLRSPADVAPGLSIHPSPNRLRKSPQKGSISGHASAEEARLMEIQDASGKGSSNTADEASNHEAVVHRLSVAQTVGPQLTGQKRELPRSPSDVQIHPGSSGDLSGLSLSEQGPAGLLAGDKMGSGLEGSRLLLPGKGDKGFNAAGDEEMSVANVGACRNVPTRPRGAFRTGAGSETRPLLSVFDILETASMWHLSACYLLTAIGGLYIAGKVVWSYKHLAQLKMKGTDSFFSMVGSLAAIGNSGGRLFWGATADRFGCFAALLGLSTCLTMLLGGYEGAESYPATLVAVVFLVHFCYGGNFSIYPTLAAVIYGTDNAGVAYGLIFTVFSFASVIGILFLTWASEHCMVFPLMTLAQLLGGASVVLLWHRVHLSRLI
ncbi:unnamed protein product [Discosporangium mesarthrocarpum]